MKVVNRKGETIDFDKQAIIERLTALCCKIQEEQELTELKLDLGNLVKKVCSGVCDMIKTSEIDNLCAEICAGLCTNHIDYDALAARIAISDHHKLNNKTFIEKMSLLLANGNVCPSILEITRKHKEAIHAAIKYGKDYLLGYFGFKTLVNAYLAKCDEVKESPQDMFMRVAIGIHGDDIQSILETYELMSTKRMIHATPTLFNAGTSTPQLSSCFLLDMADDSIEGIFDTLKKCAVISKNSGGIGIHATKIRSRGSKIKSTNGLSNGILPMLRVFESTAKYVDQGGNKRPGAFAVYLEPWHSDIFDFIDLRKNSGKEEHRARDLFLGLWIPDLFMERVSKNLEWSLFCPDEASMSKEEFLDLLREHGIHKKNTDNDNICKENTSKCAKQESKENEYSAKRMKTSKEGLVHLYDIWGDEFKIMYEHFERKGLARKTLPAQKLWRGIIDAQVETGNPYLLYKDHANRKNNQANLGTLKGSNLCTEIMEYTSPNEIAVCNLGSIALPSFIKSEVDYEKTSKDLCEFALKYNERIESEDGVFYFDFEDLRNVAFILAKNLNKIIDVNFYPLAEAKYSNMRNRPVGIGVQGLADVFAILRFPFESSEARKLNNKIFEVIYYGALQSSNKTAQFKGPYETYEGSPISEGKLQFDLWDEKTVTLDWTELRENIKKYGVRNSLLIAPMPTASTSQILGFNECIEPFTSNIYTRRTLVGDFQMINKYLFSDLHKLNLWNFDTKNAIIAADGSIQSIPSIPANIKALYKTVWEIKMKAVIDMAGDRAAFIDQSQSLNLFVPEPTYSLLTSMHFYAYKKGLKTGMYYLRTKPITTAFQFTVDKSAVKKVSDGASCSFSDGCVSCSG